MSKSKGATARNRPSWEVEQETRNARAAKYLPLLKSLGRVLVDHPEAVLNAFEKHDGNKWVFDQHDFDDLLGGLFTANRTTPLEMFELGLEQAKPKATEKPKDSPGVAIAKKKRAAKRKPRAAKKTAGGFTSKGYAAAAKRNKNAPGLKAAAARKAATKTKAAPKSPSKDSFAFPEDEADVLAFITNRAPSSVACTDVMEAEELTRDRASSLLKKLVKAGKLEQTGRLRWTRYQLPGAKPAPAKPEQLELDEDLDQAADEVGDAGDE